MSLRLAVLACLGVAVLAGDGGGKKPNENAVPKATADPEAADVNETVKVPLGRFLNQLNAAMLRPRCFPCRHAPSEHNPLTAGPAHSLQGKINYRPVGPHKSHCRRTMWDKATRGFCQDTLNTMTTSLCASTVGSPTAPARQQGLSF